MHKAVFFDGLGCPTYPDGNPYGIVIILLKDERGTYPAIGFLKNHRELYERRDGDELVLHIPGKLNPDVISIGDIVDMHVLSAKDLYQTFSNGYWKPTVSDRDRHQYPFDYVDFSKSSWTYLDVVSEKERPRYIWEFLHFSSCAMSEALSCAEFGPWFGREKFSCATSAMARRIVSDTKWTVVVCPYPRMKGRKNEPWITVDVLIQGLCLYSYRLALGDLLGIASDYDTYFKTHKKIDVATRWQDISWQDQANRLGKKIELVVFRRNARSPIGLSPSVRRLYRPDPSKGVDPERLGRTRESIEWSRSPEGAAYAEKIFSGILGR